MAMCSQILGQEKKVTQRELFYKLLCDSPDYFSSQSQVNRTVQGDHNSTIPTSVLFQSFGTFFKQMECLKFYLYWCRCSGIASLQPL